MRKIGFLLALLFLVASCSKKNKEFTLTIDLESTEYDGETLYVYDLAMQVLDSLVVERNMAKLAGTVDASKIAVIRTKKKSIFYPISCILEPGNITISNGEAHGTPLNDRLNEFTLKTKGVDNKYGEIAQLYQENKNNPLGIMAVSMLQFLRQSNMINTSSTNSYLDILELINGMGSEMQNDAGLLMVKNFIEKQSKSEVGQLFTEIEFDDSTKKLSDYVDNHKFTLVYFRALPHEEISKQDALNEVYKTYKGEDFQLLTVHYFEDKNYSDEDIELPTWPFESVLEKSEKTMNDYGLTYLGEFVLFAPDGSIYARNFNHSEVMDVVDGALKK